MKKQKVLKNFYCIEGANGSGKSTIIAELKELCKTIKSEYRYVFTCEPTRNVIGSFIRNVVSEKLHEIHHQATEYLFTADRFQHLYCKNNGILKELADKKTKVFSDRFFFSSLVYSPVEFANILNQNFPIPECVFFIKEYDKTRIKARAPKSSDNFASFIPKDSMDDRYNNIIDSYKDKTNIVYLSNIYTQDIHNNAIKILEIINKGSL